MIRLYPAAEKQFENNGICILHPLVCEVSLRDNGEYLMEVRDTIANKDLYQEGRIIYADTGWGKQAFRITNPISNNSRVDCKAYHVSYDAKNYLIRDSYAENKNCNDALNHFNLATDVPSPFTVISDIPKLANTRIVRKTLFDAYEVLISPDRYGGHWDRDNFTLGIRRTIGEDRGVVLAANKNITSIQMSEDWNDVCTKVLPYTTDGERSITLDSTYVELEQSIYDIPYSKVVKFDNELSKDSYSTDEEFLDATKKWLKNQAEEYLNSHKLPKVNYSVQANIKNVSYIGDVIHVKHPKIKVDLLTNVIGIKYDCIRGSYLNIEFGNFRKEIKDFRKDITAEIKKTTNEGISSNNVILEKELADATSKINSVMNDSFVIYDGNEILIVDKLPKETAVNCIKANSSGIGFSQHGIGGPFNSAWTIDGTMDMQQINLINLTASMIRGGTLRLGGINNSSGTFELYDETNALIGLMDRNGLKMFGKDGSYVLLNQIDGFAGFDKKGNKIYWADKDEFHMKKSVVEEEITLCNKVRFIPMKIREGDFIVNDGIGLVSTSAKVSNKVEDISMYIWNELVDKTWRDVSSLHWGEKERSSL